jgi:hypothetical protein
MRIYSDKWENVVLWDGDLPRGAVALDAAATEANLEERYEQLIDDYCKKYGVNEDAEKWTDYDATMADHAQQDAWEALWTPGNADDCYVWIKNTPSTMGRKGGKSKSDAKTAAARDNGRKGGRPRKETIVEFNGERCAWIGAWPAKRNSKILIAVLAGTSHSGVVEVGAEYLGTHNDKYGTAYDWYRLPNGARLV